MSKPAILALIPARMGSSRFPGKPMARILGKPMIGHVYERVARSSLLTHTAVATCDKEICDYIESIGGKAVMTSLTCRSGTERAEISAEFDVTPGSALEAWLQANDYDTDACLLRRVIDSAGRSLTEPAGLLPSSLARMTFEASPWMCLSCTSGVLPTKFSMDGYMSGSRFKHLFRIFCHALLDAQERFGIAAVA